MSQVSFEEIVRVWIFKCDERLPKERLERRKYFIDLLTNLNDHGYNKEDINNARKEKIVRSCVNPNHYSKRKLRNWIAVIMKDLTAAMDTYYGTIEFRTNTATPEMVAKLEAIESKIAETRTLKKPDTDEDDSEDNSDKPLDLEEEPLDIDSVVKDAVENQPTKTFEITDEILNDISEPTINWDKDFSKRFGLEDDEQS